MNSVDSVDRYSRTAVDRKIKLIRPELENTHPEATECESYGHFFSGKHCYNTSTQIHDFGCEVTVVPFEKSSVHLSAAA